MSHVLTFDLSTVFDSAGVVFLSRAGPSPENAQIQVSHMYTHTHTHTDYLNGDQTFLAPDSTLTSQISGDPRDISFSLMMAVVNQDAPT